MKTLLINDRAATSGEPLTQMYEQGRKVTMLMGDHKLENAARSMRDDFEMAYVIMKYGTQKDMQGFYMHGLRVPEVIHQWEEGTPLPPPENYVAEVSVFKEHLHDRMAGLARNEWMMKTIWQFNKRSREFRDLELENPDTAGGVIVRSRQLLTALFDYDKHRVAKILDECLQVKNKYIYEIMSKILSKTPEKHPEEV